MVPTKRHYTKLEDALNDAYTVDKLKKLAKQIGKKVPQRKAEIINHITTNLFNNLEQIVSRMKPLEKMALSEAVHNWNGQLFYRRFQAKYGGYLFGEDEEQPSGLHWYKKKTKLLEIFFIEYNLPKDLQKKLKQFIPPPATEKIHYTSLPEGNPIEHNNLEITVRETAHAALMNLNRLLVHVSEGKIKVSQKTGRATAATVKKISGELYDGDFYESKDDIGPMQAFSWPLLLQGGGLAKLDGKGLKLTRSGTMALKKNLPAAIKTMWKKWEKSKLIDEFSRVTAVKGQKSAKGRAMTSPIHRRPVINEALSCLEPGKWVAMDEMDRFMTSQNYVFSMTNYDWKLYFVSLEYGALEYFDTGALLNFRYLLIYFFEYCATLGLLDVAYQHPKNARPDYQSCWGAEDEPYLSHCDGLMYIRLNDLGAYVLGLTNEYSILNENEYIIQDADIVYTGKEIAPAEQSIQLDRFTIQQESNRWRISMDSLINAVKAGETINEIDKFINKLTSNKPKPVIDDLLKEIHRRSKAVVKKGDVTLLECHVEIRKQILTDKVLRHLCLPAGDRYIVVLPNKEERFAAYLEKLGIIIGI